MPPFHRSLLLFALAFGTGCAATPPVAPPIVSRAALGSVVVYRNGVAFFERRLPRGEKELTLRVPAERVDDFLKSLTIVDDQTGETMPVSYPTLDRSGGEVAMTIALPPDHHGLTISYVTESPAWKPSYRVVLSDDGDAQLQAWAVVDNVSGEDWRDVQVGVGSTSALSFRFDLHTVRHVERETLSSGSLLAVAPPTGGSSSAVPARSKVVASFGQRELEEVSRHAQNERDARSAADHTADHTADEDRRFDGAPTRGAFGAGGVAKAPTTSRARPSPRPAPRPDPRAPRRPPSAGEAQVARLSSLLRSSAQRVRIEGFARPGDDDATRASLENANALRDALIEQGVSPHQVVAVGTGKADGSRAVEIVRLDETAKDGETGEKKASVDTSAPSTGQALFLSDGPMTVERDHSAMVSIVHARAKAKRVYFYDPISDRGSDAFAFNAIRLENPTDTPLDAGPFTVYAEDQFLGEGLTESILPHGTAFVPYGLDRTILVEPEVDHREDIDRLVTIQRGIVESETRAVRTTTLAVHNRGTSAAEVFLRHAVAPGHELVTEGAAMPAPEKLHGAHLFRVAVAAGETVKLTIEEWTPAQKHFDLRTDAGMGAIAAYISGAHLPEALKAQLAALIERHQRRADLGERMTTLQDQMVVYRERVDELEFQLATLRKLDRGQKLRRHLSDKMEEISERLQTSTMELADLKARMMTHRIELQDALAELTLTAEAEPLAKSDGGSR